MATFNDRQTRRKEQKKRQKRKHEW